MDVISGCICVAAKIGSLSEWDHVGIVVENPEGELCVLEANMSGVSCHRLEDRLRRTKSKIAVRSLSGPKTRDFKEQLWSLAVDNMEKSYNSSMTQFMSAWYHGLASHGVNKKLLQVLAMKHELDLLRIEQTHHNAATSPLISALIQARINVLAASISSSDSNSLHPLPAQSTKECYFCSELVTSLYHRLGVLDRTREGNTYVPAEYSSTVRMKGLFFKNGFQLSPNIPIIEKNCKISSEKGFVFVHQPYRKTPLQLQFSSGDKLFVSSYHIPQRQFIHVNNGQLKILHQSSEYDTCYGKHIAESNRDTVARVVMHLEESTNNRLAEMKKCESFDAVILQQSSVSNIWRMLYNDALIFQSDGRALLTIGQHEKADFKSRQKKAFHVDTGPIDSYYLHEKSVDLLLNLLHASHQEVPESTRNTFLLGSEILYPTKDPSSLLRSKDMIYFVLRGELQSFAENRRYGVRARSGDILNTECFVGADIRNNWRAIEDEVAPVVLGVDRWVLSATGVAMSSWLWATVIEQQQSSSLSRIILSFKPRITSLKISPMLDDITIDNAVSALNDINNKDMKEEITNALVAEHFDQILRKQQLPPDAVASYVPVLVASAAFQKQVDKIMKESEEAGEYGRVKKKIVATSYHQPAPQLWTYRPLLEVPVLDLHATDTSLSSLWVAAVVHMGMRYLKVLRK